MRASSMIDETAIMLQVLAESSDHDKWDGAPFERIKRVSNTKVGDIGQEFLERVCLELGFECVFPINAKGKRAKQSPWDVQINGVKFELKTATEDVSGSYQFNHIRYHRDYEGLICIGVSPDRIYFNIWSKAEVTTNKAGTLVTMEKGANASYKLTKKPISLTPISEFAESLVAFVDNFQH